MDRKVNLKGRLTILVFVLAVSGDVWSFTTETEGLGAVRLDLWWNIDCSTIPCLLNDSRYPDNPDETRLLTSFNSGLGLGDDYGGMIHGWLHPRESGDYTFWLCTDKSGELFLSTDESPANMQLIASESSWAKPFTWISGGEEQSAPISLVGGLKYYIRAVWISGYGGDHCMVAWQGPDQPLAPVDGSAAAIIPGSQLSPFEQSSAYDPDPYDGQASVPTTYTLRWEAGEYAAEHDVYLSTSKALVESRDAGVFQGRVVPNNFGPIGLDTGAMYYWAIDEVNDGGPDPGRWYGPTWFFRTEGAAGGLLGSYYHWSGSLTPNPGGGDPGPRRPFNDFVMSRVDREVNFNWGLDSPDPSIRMDQFACKWTGHVEAPVDANYTFYTTTDDGARLFIDGVQILPDAAWQIQAMTEWSGSVMLTAGLHDIEMHYFEYLGGAGAELRWSSIPVSPSDNAITKQIIPPMWLWPPLYATAEQPADESIIDNRTPALEWEPGFYAVYHELYFSSNYDDVNDRNPVYKQILSDPCHPYPLGPPLQFKKTYYWCVDEVRSITEKWDARTIWSFTTPSQLIFVDIDANGANNGTNWKDAYNYLQDALADANSSEKPVEILVAQGIYKPDQGGGQTSGDLTATFKLINGVTINGGFAGFGELNPNARDTKLYETILSGDLAGNDVEVDDLEYLLIDPCRADNSYRVVTGSWTDVNSVLDGFTITAANNDRTGFPISAGGGVFIYEGNPTITNCILKTNAAGDWGGGMYVIGSQSYIYNCIFIGNYSISGGGMCTGACNSTISNCKFIANQATRGGGARNISGDINLMNCLFVGNAASAGGGFASRTSSPTLTNCILWDNISDQVYVSSGNPVVTYCDVQDGWSGLGNIDVDPCFADANNGDYHLKSQAGRWDANSESWIKDDVTSPCIDAGNPGCPVDDETVPNGNRINMGAYGGTAEASKSPTYWRSLADTTNDWIVDSNDLKVLADYWLQMGECIPGDFDRSQSVDFNDFAILGGLWSQKGPGPGITYDIGGCIPVDFPSSTTEEPNETRFTVTVEGSNIHFEDMITANCCADEIELQMTVEAGLITIYEIEHTSMPPCPCICDYPITAKLGPFEPGTYIFEVYHKSSFIGSTTVTIENDQ